ncbi:MAG: hypothetical protein AAFZ58_13860 [Pseudomonadota bacterium]
MVLSAPTFNVTTVFLFVVAVFGQADFSGATRFAATPIVVVFVPAFTLVRSIAFL